MKASGTASPARLQGLFGMGILVPVESLKARNNFSLIRRIDVFGAFKEFFSLGS